MNLNPDFGHMANVFASERNIRSSEPDGACGLPVIPPAAVNTGYVPPDNAEVCVARCHIGTFDHLYAPYPVAGHGGDG